MSQYIFYKIVCEDCPDYIYIGSTKAFRRRKNQHKSICNNLNDKSHNKKLYNKIREFGGWENWSMVIIDEGNYLTLTDARIKEEELRVKYNGNLNMIKAYITEEDKIKNKNELNKKYLEKRREYNKEYRKNNKEKIKEYNKEYTKEYRENNKEKIKERNREYRERKKEEK